MGPLALKAYSEMDRVADRVENTNELEELMESDSFEVHTMYIIVLYLFMDDIFLYL